MTSLILRGTIVLSSLILIIISTVTLYMAGNALHLILRTFPSNRYVWHGPMGIIRDDWPNTHNVTMNYDSATENLIFVAAGSSALAGIFGILKMGFQEWRRRRQGNADVKDSSASNALSYMASFLASFTFIASIVSAVYVNEHHANVRKNTCHWGIGESHDAVFTCTRELAVCNIFQYLGEREQGTRKKSCQQIQDARGMLIPLAAFSLFLSIGYGVQVWLARREKKLGWIVDEKGRRLEHEE